TLGEPAKLAAGYSHACALMTDGSIWCWGDNASGQLGPDVGEVDRATPVKLPGTHWTDIASANAHTCGLRRDGSAWCWGANDAGQLGTGSEDSLNAEPQPVAKAGSWKVMSAGA